MASNPKTKRTIPQEMLVIDSFPEKIKGLMEAISKNLETTVSRLEMVEELMKETEDELKNSRK